MTVNYNDWGYEPNTSSTLYCAYPMDAAPAAWVDSDGDVRQKIRARLHVDIGASDFYCKIYLDSDDAQIAIYEDNSISDTWTSTWPNAPQTPDYPEGKKIWDFWAHEPPHYHRARIYLQEGQRADRINGIEVGAVNDIAYAAPYLPAEETARAGANRQYTNHRFATSFLATYVVCHTYNRITERARWRVSCPLCGFNT